MTYYQNTVSQAMTLSSGSALRALEDDASYENLRINIAVDRPHPNSERDVDKSFGSSRVQSGRGTVATGRVERGQVRVGDEVEIVSISEETSKNSCYRC